MKELKNFRIGHHLLIGASIIGKMTWKAQNFTKHISLLVFILLYMVACSSSEPTNTPSVTSTQLSATPALNATTTTAPIELPTIDPKIPLAAIVNGQGITKEEYEAELARALAASEMGLVTFSKEDVLQNLIDEVLLAQAAAEAGFFPDEALIQTRIDQLGLDQQTLQNWMDQNGYTQDGFAQKFTRAISAAWMRDQIISNVSNTAEQVHARQILLYNASDAENAYAELQSGTDFATLAAQYDPISSGELGWFPRGYLTVPELDEPVFSLQPGEYTEIIETMLGFHIVQVIDRDPQHLLSPGAFQTYQVQAVKNWLVERRSQSDIQIFVS